MQNEKKVQVKNILDYEVFPQYDLIWCDPPWGQRMVNWFNTKLFKDTGIKISTSFIDIINKLGSLSNPEKPMFIVYEKKGYETVIDILAKYGHKMNKIYQVLQKNGNPCVVISFNTDVEVVTSREGLGITAGTLNNFPRKNMIVFDPFAGIGYTRKAVEKSGNIYLGSELNPKRASK